MREMLCLEHAVLILCLFTCKASLINSWISVSPFVINITHSGNLHISTNHLWLMYSMHAGRMII